MDKQVILVTGSNGQVGKELQQLATAYPQFRFVFASREDMKLHHFGLVENFFAATKPEYCINCAAYTAVDKAESEQEMAILVNGEAVGNLAAVCKKYNTKLIHISTDYVFDGESETPYKEEDATGPINTYGRSKLLGEQLCMKEDEDAIIIRTAWVYSSYGHNFVKTMMRLMNERNELNVVADQIGSPTYAADLAKAMLDIISSGKWESGIYHYSNEGKISWFEFAEAIKKITGSKAIVHPIETSQYPTPAKRPHYSLLNKSKIKSVYSIAVPEWKQSLADCIALLQETK
ncbi:dTDP-4-dehydrorhamnose reductase [Lacibacter luteus]|uniref:dTDP-4-dehydrorhamnose reductase n=1 Tax=Lacibacter luteus TaxID=2508719 RepID=A0A4Q1CP90_9BACT|nr:dTDP-4-dehydrorhamnose reductase [Lacibacter luteus]RXK62459.1 dTDP-4-dehydrorhamnose reductase [Lacibacter luteus]